MDKKQFIEGTLTETVCAARSYVNRLEFCEEDETVAIVCQNGHRYWASVACDSLGAIVEDVMKEVQRH